MKIRNWMLTIIALVCPVSILFEQDGVSASKQVALLNDAHPALAKAAIAKAASEGESESLFVAMHNPDHEVKMFALDHVSLLSKPQQAQLMSRILLDDNALRYAGELHLSLGLGSQTWIQERILQISCRLLNLPLPPYHGLITRAEAAALATRLSAIK